MALRSLWGQCMPRVVLAGALKGHGHGYGLGTLLLHGRHPAPGINLVTSTQVYGFPGLRLYKRHSSVVL